MRNTADSTPARVAHVSRSLYALTLFAALTAACGGGAGPVTTLAPAEPRATDATAAGPVATAPTPSAGATATPTQSGHGPEAAAREQKRLQAAGELLAEGRLIEATGEYRALAQVAVDAAVRADAYIGAGVALGQDGADASSIDALTKAREVAPAGSVQAVRAGYLLGVRLNDAGRPGDAYPVLMAVDAGAAGATRPLVPYVEAERARAAGLLGRTSEAASRWESVLAIAAGAPSMSVRAHEALARLAVAAGDGPALGRWLDVLTPLGTDAAVLHELAARAESAGEHAAAARAWRRVLTAFPGSSAAGGAVSALRASGEYVDPGEEGFSLYRRGLYAGAIGVLAPVVDAGGLAPAARAFRLFYLGAAREDSGDLRGAIADYDQAAAAWPLSIYAHRARYWAARTSERLGLAAEASARYVALVGEGPGGEFTAEAAFRAGHVLLAAGDAPGALAAWAGLGIPGDARVLYWQGRAYEATGDSAGARAAYGASALAGPLTFYGGRSKVRLGDRPAAVTYQERGLADPIDWESVSVWLRAVAGEGQAGGDVTAARELMGLGLRAEAATAVREAAASATGAWALFGLVREAREVRLTAVSAQLASRLVARFPGTEAPRALVQLAYPLDYVGTLDAESRAYGIDPLFLAALVRQESYWDPEAGSHAGALGLTQVIAPTGEAIARSLGLSFRPRDLLRPAISLQFGANYLAAQLRGFGSPAVALAAYNAGPESARRWAAAAGSADSADFVEVVDFVETRAYVTLVLEHYARYLWAYGG